MSRLPRKALVLLFGTHLAALAVLVWAAHFCPPASPAFPWEMFSGDKWAYPDGTADICTFGAGYLHIPAALNSTYTPTIPVLSPALYRDANGNVYLDTTQITALDGTVYGSPDSPDYQYIWGTSVVAGSNQVSGSQYVWGSSVWADQYVWGTSSATVDLSATALAGEQ